MDTLAVVAKLKPYLQQWTRGWMLVRATDDYGVEIGLSSGQQFWIVGRAGVLGDCDADVAAGGLAFLAPNLVRGHWESLPAGMTPRSVAAQYAQRVFAWGESELPRFGDATLRALDEGGRLVANHAPASIGLVFAGWRAMPQPDTLAARAALTMHVLRELRGAAHIVAVTAVGLSPLQSVLASPAPPPRSGPAWAEHLGWTGPFEDPEPLKARRDEAEHLTNEILVPHFAALGDGLDDWAGLVMSVRDAIDM